MTYYTGVEGRRLYRDSDRAVLGGVCAGLARYLGFNLKVTHEHWQFKPDLGKVMAVCRDSIYRYAPEIAATKEREIVPIDDSKISMSYNRNHSSGSSTCTATYAVAYK